MNWLEQIQDLAKEFPAAAPETAAALPVLTAVEAPGGLPLEVTEGFAVVAPVIDSAWLIGLALGAILLLGALVTILVVIHHNRRLGTRLARLESELTVYTEASTRVAQTLEAVLLGRTRTSQSVQTSRRYLLIQARERFHRGESPQGIARGLGLSHDEVRLLEHANRLRLEPESAETQQPQPVRECREGFVRPVSVELPEGGSPPDAAVSTDPRQWKQDAG
ncbi:MAG: hypothetical protein R3E82_04445 [Pseudomonadales bacterium]|nr:hypothetical protein [Pseudomonadales bacterium]